MKFNSIYIFILFSLIIQVSCITNKDTRLLQEKNSVPIYDSTSYSEYKLKINDELLIRVSSLNEDVVSAFNLGTTAESGYSGVYYRVFPDGTIDVPFADSISVVGLTLNQAQTKIENRLKVFMDDIEVQVSLSNNVFYVIGKSGRGKFVIYKDRLNIYQAIALANFTPGFGDLRNVTLIRQLEDGTTSIKSFDLRSKFLIESEFYYIQPNDVIYVPDSKGSFFKIQSFSSFMSVISTSMAFLLLFLQYVN